MSSQSAPVTIRVLDKEYMVSCPPEERESLVESAKLLDRRMRETRDGGKVLGTERMAVMAALNIVHELLQTREEHQQREQMLGTEMHRLGEKIQSALGRRSEDDALD